MWFYRRMMFLLTTYVQKKGIESSHNRKKGDQDQKKDTNRFPGL